MKSLLKSATAILFCVAVLMTTFVSAASPSDVKDMPPVSRYSYTPLTWALDLNLIDPKDGNIVPGQDLLRAELADIMVRYLGRNVTTIALAPYYDDVDKDAWYYDSLGKAYQMGIIQGYNRMMRPLDKITREEAFTILARTLKISDEAKDIDEMKAFSDADTVSDWAVKKVAALVKAGYILGGTSATNAELKVINPKSNISREEFITIIWRMRNHPTITEPKYFEIPITTNYKLEIVTSTSSTAEPVAQVLQSGLSTPEGQIDLNIPSTIVDSIPLSDLKLTVSTQQSSGKRRTYFGMELIDGQSYTFQQLFNELATIAEAKSHYVGLNLVDFGIHMTNSDMGDLRKLYELVNIVYTATIDTRADEWEALGITMASKYDATIKYDIFNAANVRTAHGVEISLNVQAE